MPGDLCELTSMFIIHTAISYATQLSLSNQNVTAVTIKGSLCVVVCPTPPLPPCVWMSVGVGMSELV